MDSFETKLFRGNFIENLAKLEVNENFVGKKEDKMVQSVSTKLSAEEVAQFESVFDEIVGVLTTDSSMKDMPKTLDWLKTVLHYNVPHGKKVRGLMIPMTYKCIVPNATKEDLRLTYVLGWCIEILQACFLVADDIMDESETRRGSPCWHLVDGMGVIALNDSFMLEHTVFEVVRKYFRGKSYYPDLIELFLLACHKTTFGQSLDTQTGNDRKLEDYNLERYASIVKYKTSYYTAYLPVALTLAMVGMETIDSKVEATVERITLEIGHYFQVQDDYLDCFGDEQKTGKIGTDIQDCKCSWLFVTAREKCTPEQWELLKENYGHHDNHKVSIVKKLYRELDLPGEYAKYEETAYQNFCKQISQVKSTIPEAVFFNFLNLIYKRGK